MKLTARPFVATLVMASCLALSACFSPSPEKLNHQIEEGQAAKALTSLEEQLQSEAENPTLNLLAVKATLALCAERNCPITNPNLLNTVSARLAKVPGPVNMGKDLPTLAPQEVIAQAITRFAELQHQPEAMLLLYGVTPAAHRTQVENAIFLPALNAARQQDYESAAQTLSGIANANSLPRSLTYTANVLAGLFGNSADTIDPYIIALRSENTAPPANATALLPWAMLAQATHTTMANPPAAALQMLTQAVETWKIGSLTRPGGLTGMGSELATIATTAPLLAVWSTDWPNNGPSLGLELQRLALTYHPNQPEVWARYLPSLAQANASMPGAGSLANLSATIILRQLNPTQQQHLGGELITTAQKMVNTPAISGPLVTLAAAMSLSKEQQINLDKLTQDILLKATDSSDVTTTIIISRAKPQVAVNNRQTVVPLLVTYIRTNLREGNFEEAVNTADLLNNKLKMNIEFEPLILQEFTDSLKRNGIDRMLDANNTDILLQPADTAAIGLGPIFEFMQDYFAEQPTIITSQLTTLISNANGLYAPATAMYRLQHLFPEEGMSAQKRQEWLNLAITEALLNDTTLNGPSLANAIAKLAPVHPTLSLAPLVEAALKKITSLEDSLTLWQQAPANIRAVIKSVRPQFASLMQGIDSLQAKNLNAAAEAFSQLTEANWQQQAAPYINTFHEHLADLTGTYTPVNLRGQKLNTAALILSPAGLNGGILQSISITLISRMGTQEVTDPLTLSRNPAAIQRLSLAVPYNFNTRALALTPQVLAQVPQAGSFAATFGTLTQLTVQPANPETNQPAMLIASYTGLGPVTFVRQVANTATPLTPNGTYLIGASLNKPISGTSTILPAGSILTLQADVQNTQPALPEADPYTSTVHPLTGTLMHPAGNKAITFTGTYNPATLAATFTFSYPLPASHQPVKAATRCQALAGTLICGSHHLHSPRQEYATLVSGQQTQESQLEQSRLRQQDVPTQRTALLSHIASPASIPSPATTSTIFSTNTTGGLLPPPSFLTSPSTKVSSTPAPLSATTLISQTIVKKLSPTAVSIDSFLSTLKDPSPTTSPTTPSSTLPKPQRITIDANAPIPSNTIAPGTFIHRVSTPVASPTPTIPAPAAAMPSLVNAPSPEQQ